ncbi:MAG: peptidase MA family metallohydrolase [Bacillota bacterium]
MQLIINNKSVIAIILIILFIFVILPDSWGKVRFQAYKILRTMSRIHMDYITRDFDIVKNDNVSIKYKSNNRESAILVANTTREIIGPVNTLLGGYSHSESVPIILYPTMDELNKSFGWEGDKSPMGVYWMGTIRVLAPEAWIGEEEQKETIFRNMGPMAHEYAHLVVDYKTNGNYTRWFTEGVAQYLEKEITGFTLDEPDNSSKENIYPFSFLDRDFDEQQNQELAYWQSLIAVEYLTENYGSDIIKNMLVPLGQGQDFSNVIKNFTGMDLTTFEGKVKEYAKTK